MVIASVDPDGGPPGRRRLPLRFAGGVALPLAVVALAYALWWLSDRVGYIGPLDRAAFGWAVVIPVWLAAPIVAGLAWRRLSPRGSIVAAVVFGAIVSGTAAVLFWQAVAFPSCEFPVRAPIDWVLPSLFVGAVIGAGPAATGLIASKLVRAGHPWRAAVLGTGAEIVMVFAAILVAGIVLLGPGCQRPPV